MKRIALKYGAISGLILAILFVLSFAMFKSIDFGYAIGYATMLLSLSTIFFGIKAYRDAQPDQAITYWRAFQVGLMITLVASTLYVIVWKIFYTIAMPDWFDSYTKHSMDELRKSGATPEKMAEQLKQMQEYKELYKNPLYEFGMTFLEIFPVGILVSLISSALLRKRKK